MQRYLCCGSGLYGHVSRSVLRSLTKSPSGARSLAIVLLFFFLLILLLLTASLPTRLLFNSSAVAGTTTLSTAKPVINNAVKPGRRKLEIPLNCTAYNVTRSCPSNYPTSYDPDRRLPDATCPGYFRWIHEDLKPWSRTGISRDVLERARATANFRLTIIDGRAYVETYKKSFQTRDVFTLWGILQLLRRYPGRVPDLELMFDCVDWPVIPSRLYTRPNATSPPPLFRYCGDDATLDVVFPDWSFWGWPEVNIKPWESLLKELKEGNEKIKWMDREPYAYWKGNPAVAVTRQDLMKCNVSNQQEWNARVYQQDWIRESQQGYKQSDLASQCIHRYKIYIEGSAWSVSEKYILACNSVTLLVKPRYYDFFTRGLMPVHHYWPVKDDDKCKSIKFAVDWGNSHKQKAQAIGNAASDFIQDELRMDLVYDYMFHLLNEYSKLLRFKPKVSENTVELCPETMACQAKELEKKFMEESLVKRPADSYPCELPPPFDITSLYVNQLRKANSISQVEMWEDRFWEAQKL